ncbi:hypothetical protein BGX20_010527 [Mortierella sp. AD010]|nr:hypothetical protein BGX20_010527 [Mortierella sp. AD010]
MAMPHRITIRQHRLTTTTNTIFITINNCNIPVRESWMTADLKCPTRPEKNLMDTILITHLRDHTQATHSSRSPADENPSPPT